MREIITAPAEDERDREFRERTRYHSDIENEALLARKPGQVPVFVKIYFATSGFTNSAFFFFMICTMHYFKAQYSGYTFSVFSMLAVKATVFLIFPFVPLISKLKISPWIIGCTLGTYLCLLVAYQLALRYPNQPGSLMWCLASQAVGALLSNTLQAVNLRVVLFYHYSVVAYYYASAVFGCLVLSSLGLALGFSGIEGRTFMLTMLVVTGFFMGLACVLQSILHVDSHFNEKCKQEASLPPISIDRLKGSIEVVRHPAGMLLLTLTLTAITYRTIYYEVGPATISQAVWINATNIIVNSSEFLGRSLGDLFRLNFIIHKCEWYPWVYNIIICGVFIINKKWIFDSFWGLFWPLIIFLTFRNGFAITYFQAKIAAKNPNDPNCVIIGNLAKETGNAFGAILSSLVLVFKNYVNG